jgi:adenine phosphoribosyltransferase
MPGLGERIRAVIRDVPDFPQPGIVFKDITPVLADVALMRAIVERLADTHRRLGIDVIAGVESRGFLFGTPLAMALGAGFTPIRKPGKLPWQTLRVNYSLEYGQDSLEAHTDAVRPGQRVLIVDDLLATGGTAGGAVDLVRRLGGEVVGAAFVIELAFLNGRSKLEGIPASSLVCYE